MKKRILMITLVTIMCMALTACNETRESETTEEEYQTEQEYHYLAEDMEKGTALGSFVSTDLEGNEVTEAIFAEKDLTILNVWATYCGPCLDEMPDLCTLANELPDNAQIIGMVIDVPEGDSDMLSLAKEICKDNKISYTNIVMNGSVYNVLSNIEAVPTTFLLDRSGQTVCRPIIGADVESYRQAALEYLGQAE